MAINLDPNKITVKQMQQVSDFMNTRFKQNLVDQFNNIIDIYVSLQNLGILSSDEIDPITTQIQSKLTEITNNFEELLIRFNKEMNTYIETIEIKTSNIKNDLADLV